MKEPAAELNVRLAAERRLPEPPSGARERILARVRTSVASPLPPPGAPPAGFALKLALLATGGAGLITFAIALSQSSAPAPHAAAPVVVARTVQRVELAPSLATPPTIIALSPAPESTPAPAPASTPAPTPTNAISPSAADAKPARDPSVERGILDRAQAALAAGYVPAALNATREHMKAFPRGALTEEREVLRIRALIAGGDKATAHTVAAAFRKRFPRSIHGAAVDALSPP